MAVALVALPLLACGGASGNDDAGAGDGTGVVASGAPADAVPTTRPAPIPRAPTPATRVPAAPTTATGTPATVPAPAGPASTGPASVPTPDTVPTTETVPTTAAPTTTVAPPTVAPTAARPAPVAIRAPSVGIESSLLHMGLQADDGGVEVPDDFDLAGWYREGGRPGGPGPIVVVGHVDSRRGPAVFYRLRDLAPGDIVEVTVEDGGVARYAVTGTEQFPKAEFPTFSVLGATNDDVLRLVTCTGEFNRDIRSYYDNLVVTAVRVS